MADAEIRFYRLWLKTAFPKAWAIAGSVSFVLSLAAGAAAWRYPSWQGALTDLSWALPLGVLVLIFLFRLGRAPLEIYGAQQDLLHRAWAVTRHSQQKQEARTQVAARLIEGQSLLRRCMVATDDPSLEREGAEWETRTSVVLTTLFDVSYAVRFVSVAGLEQSSLTMLTTAPVAPQHYITASKLHPRLVRLHEILTDLQTA